MVSIRVNGQDKTQQISDWKIWRSSKTNELKLTCYFPSGKSYSCDLSQCEIDPTEVVQGKLLRKKGSVSYAAIDSAVVYGEKYAVVRYSGNPNPYVMKAAGLEFSAESSIKTEAAFNYFLTVAKARVARAASEENRLIAENVCRQLEGLLPHPSTALAAYCTGRIEARASPETLIFPFGLNESQLQAVERAFSSQISVIEGPPGTGKTQTILNIVANILLRGKTVAILSNNNMAVSNVSEKLAKVELDYLVAKLGNSENRNVFFANPPATPADAPDSAPGLAHIEALQQKLKRHLHAQNAAAILQAEVDELSLERRRLLTWQRDAMPTSPSLGLQKYGLSAKKTADLIAYLTSLAERRIRLKDRLGLFLNFNILRTAPFADFDKRQSAVLALQIHYYDKALEEKSAALLAYREALDQGDFKALLEALVKSSMAQLKWHLHQHCASSETFDAQTYRTKFDAFVKRYPIISSSTHSILNSIKHGAVLDYAIIDEASQQDIVPGVLALGCVKNLIVVGDRKQLPHIPANVGIAPPADHYDCEKYSLLDSCIGVFGRTLPVTLLQEHYRCHPKIIQFCNQQFYDGQLIPMTRDKGELPLQMVVTAKGNHSRGYANQREIDSILDVLQQGGEFEWDSETGRGFIAPYNAQVNLSRTRLPEDFVKKTTHKFQGQECDEIVFSTVLDKRSNSEKNLGFVDDPNLINVAVSRAKHKFTLVTGDDIFVPANGPIAALMRYIEYHAEESQIKRAPVVSAFDLLYQEYDQSLERLNAKLRSSDSQFKSEQIVAQILRDILAEERYRAITFHMQIRLDQLASPENPSLTARERDFMQRHASCDFVLYYRVGKKPLGVIEVDGGSHTTDLQAERDAQKDSILSKNGFALLRLKTIESHIEDKVASFLTQCMGEEPFLDPRAAEVSRVGAEA